MATNIAERTLLNTVIGDRSDLYDQLQGYGHIFIGGITLVLMGLCVVYMLHRFAARPLNRRIGNRRLIRVLFGYLYALVLVTTMLLAIRRLGFEVENLSRVAYLLLSLLAVLAYFLAPFFSTPALHARPDDRDERRAGVCRFHLAVSHHHPQT